MDSKSGFIQGHPELVSVIVPVYKVEEYLDICVRSIAQQTYTNLEIILVDDGSPDGCGAMCDAWAAKDSRIKVIHKENGGLSDARNAGMKVATGTLVSFIDGDDLIKPDFMEMLLGAMEAYDAQIAECAVELVGEQGGVIGHWKTANVPVMDKIEGLRRMIMEDGIYTIVSNKLYRRQVLEGILFEKGKYHEDEFWTYQVFDRMERLSKYEQLKDPIHQQLIDHLWHMQRILRCLQGQERKAALAFIMKIKKATPRVPFKKLVLPSTRHRIWYTVFCFMPKLTARLRNLLKIDC